MARNAAEVALGPIFVGLFLNTVLYGILIMQVFLYPKSSKNDKPWIKLMVVLLLLADTLHTVFAFIYVYQSLVVNYGNPTFLAHDTWLFSTGNANYTITSNQITDNKPWDIEPAMTGIITAIVHAFYAWRVRVLTRNVWIASCLYVLLTVALLGSLGVTIATGIVTNFVEFQKFQAAGIVWLVSEALCDVIITSSLVWYLKKNRSQFPQSTKLIDQIMQSRFMDAQGLDESANDSRIEVTIQTGMITSIVGVADLLLYLLDSTGDHLALNILLAKLYSNSLMSSLNARQGWGSYQSDTSTSQGIISAGGIANAGSGVQVRLGRHTQVHVAVESHEMRDIPGQSDTDLEATSGWTDTKKSAGNLGEKDDRLDATV